MTKLHLGCGRKYLDGYVNIDYPTSEHTVQETTLVADVYANISDLIYPAGTVDEVRLHHVFEHFPRQTALGLLCRWTDWLKPGGTLRIETPDLMASAWALVSPFTTSVTRQQIVRHLFGSHEAHWAAHWDGWYKSRFRATLAALGYRNMKFTQSRWSSLRNIEVCAERGNETFTPDDYRTIARDILSRSLITSISSKSLRAVGESEQAMLEVWMREWEQTYTGQSPFTMSKAAKG
jgi:predicted SAM-dependent methyltransferase